MFKFLSLLACLPLFADSLSVSTFSNVYPIDVSIRGSAILNMYNGLASGGSQLARDSDFAIGLLTTTSGFLQPIRSMAGSTNNTILIVNYGGAKNVFTTQTTIVLPVEQIEEVVFNNAPFTSTNFSTGVPSNTIPYFYINMSQRAADIQSIFNTLNSGQYSSSPRANSTVNFQTTLKGPFYGGISSTGLITSVQQVGSNGNTTFPLLLIGYGPPNTQS